MNSDYNSQRDGLSTFLQPSSIAKYNKDISKIYKELYRLNSNLFILKKLMEFRSDLFLDLIKMDFINLVMINFTYESCLICTKLTTDKRDTHLTLKRFHTWVRENLLPGHLNSFDKASKDCNIEKTIDLVWEKIRPLRKDYIAHLVIKENIIVPQETGTAYEDLRVICDQLIKFFNIHSFGCEYKMLPIEYDPNVQHPNDVDKRPDIEHILDLLVQDSVLYNLPEKPHFQQIRPSYPAEWIDLINSYRIKFGKNTV